MAMQELRPCSWVLVVDDDPEIREATTNLLESAGYKTCQASNGREALDLLARMPHPCLILLDMLMPVMNGAEFCEKLAAQHTLATLPVVIVAGIHGFQPRGARGLLRKPVSADLLLRVVAEFCGTPPA